MLMNLKQSIDVVVLLAVFLSCFDIVTNSVQSNANPHNKAFTGNYFAYGDSQFALEPN